MFDEVIIAFLLHFFFSDFLILVFHEYESTYEKYYFDVELFNASIYLRFF